MKKILFCVAEYKDHRQDIFDNHYSPKNQQYADKWGYEYRVYKKQPEFRGNPTWWKFTLLQEMIKGELSEGDVVVNLDADMVIVDGSEDYYQGMLLIMVIAIAWVTMELRLMTGQLP